MEATTQIQHSPNGHCPSCGQDHWVACEDPDKGLYKCLSCETVFTTDKPLVECMTCLYLSTKEQCEGCLEPKPGDEKQFQYRHHKPGNGIKRSEDRRQALEDRLKAKPYALKYRGFWNHVNSEPQGDWIEIWVSDWNKDFWGFYAHIAVDNYDQDIEAINDLITILNWRDGDVYIELIDLPAKDAFEKTPEGHKDYPTDLGRFYEKMYDIDSWSHSSILNPRYWKGYFEDPALFLSRNAEQLFNLYWRTEPAQNPANSAGGPDKEKGGREK